MQIIEQKTFTEERALYRLTDADVRYATFAVGESPIKENRDVTLRGCLFKWRYPIWYSDRITVEDSTMYADARAALWYCRDVSVTRTEIAAPKCVRRCENISLLHVTFSNAQETCWHCHGIDMKDVTAVGDYFCMNSQGISIDGLRLTGKYSFDGVRDVRIENAHMVTKDAFWNSENVYVKNSTVLGEYLGWNSKNVTFENCVIDTLQGLCYMDGVRLINCRLVNTSLAFEYSVVDATVTGCIDSVFNPRSGRIVADRIGELTIDPSCVHAKDTVIEAEVDRMTDKPTW